MIKIRCDFETQSLVNLKKSGAYEYSIHPSTKIMCFGFKRAGAQNNVQLFTYHQISKPFYSQPRLFQVAWLNFIKSNDYVFTAHNAYFEECIYNNILVKRNGWPPIPIHKWRCNAAKAAAVAIPRNLSDAGAVMNVSVQKDYEGHRVMMKLCRPTYHWNKWNKAVESVRLKKRVATKTRALAESPEPQRFYTPETNPEDFRILYRYNKIDIWAEEKLDDSLPELTDYEQKLWFIDQKINMRGVLVDMPLIKRIVQIMEAEIKVMNSELDSITMGLITSGNARQAILDFLVVDGLELPDLKAKTVDEFLANGKASGDAEKILKLRKALSKSSTAKYKTFLLRAASDGRVRDLLLFLAASTGRWGGKGIQPQNMPRGVIKDIYLAIENIKTLDVDTLKVFYGENLMPLFSSVLRGMFIATPEHQMFVEDYNAIELRVLWWLSGQTDFLNELASGKDPYRKLAALLYEINELEVTDEQRQVGKAAELGCGFGQGDRKFVSSAYDVYRVRVTKEIAKKAVTLYRKRNWRVVEMWKNYNEACIFAVENPGRKYRVGRVKFFVEGKFLWIELPSGRRLAYFGPKVEVQKVFSYYDPESDETLYTSHIKILKEAIAKGCKYRSNFGTKQLSYMAINNKAKKEDCTIPRWTRERSYGGKICENIVQAVARDLLADAIVRSEKAGFDVLMHSHDENVVEAKGKVQDEFKRVMAETPKWAEGLPIKTSGFVDTRYRKG